MQNNIAEQFGNIDIYLFDQLLKGRFDYCTKVLDAGCGNGRNVVYFLRNGFEVYGVDQSAEAVQMIKALAAKLAPGNPPENFTVGNVEDIAYPDNYFDVVICSAVLHFAYNPRHFDQMVKAIWRVLKPGGFLFTRLASNIGIEGLVKPLGEGRYLLPDGTQRFLVNMQMLLDYTNALRGALYEPIKTTNVQNVRCMTTWCLTKN
jgi:SAM-dependent methyltransferase